LRCEGSERCERVKVLIVSGIWPPDVGGPATHAPEVAEFLRGRGHEVEVLTTAEAEPAPRPYPVHWVPRGSPAVGRYARGAAMAARAAGRADVVYSTGMIGRTRVGALLGRAPRVVKLTGDPAYERALRYGLTTQPLDDFQDARGARIAALKAVRSAAMSGASLYLCPSESLRAIASRWNLVDSERIRVLPNPVAIPELAGRDELRRRHGFAGPTLVAAGRLVPQKALEVAFEALRQSEGVTLVLAGDGPERDRLGALAHGLPVRFLGAQPRETVFELLAAADAVLLSSTWENFPHAVVEGLAVGTPVIATAAGGVTEIVEDGRNGLLAPPQDPVALAAAIRRFFEDEGLRERLRAAAAGSVARYRPPRIYEQLESLLLEAAR
jgi:glycosyltransferase involved in cell wall biosynthesis